MIIDMTPLVDTEPEGEGWTLTSSDLGCSH
jgi:hypothetical protein